MNKKIFGIGLALLVLCAVGTAFAGDTCRVTGDPCATVTALIYLSFMAMLLPAMQPYFLPLYVF